MNPVIVGIIGIIVLIVLFLFRLPVGFALALVGILGFGYLVSPEAGFGILARDVFHIFSSYSLTVIPMFVLMGSIASASGMSRRLYEASYNCCWLCWLRCHMWIDQCHRCCHGESRPA